jgi:hypothetical protein
VQGAETSEGIQSINIGTRIQEQKYYVPSRGIQREERIGIVRATLSSVRGVETSGGIRSINMGTIIQEWEYYAPSGGI